MSTTPVRHQRFRLGVAVYGAEFVVSLALFAISIGLVILATVLNAPMGILVATTAFILGTGAFCVWTGAAVFFQARPGPSSLGRRSVVWAPPLVMRVAMVVIAASLGTVTAAVATMNPRPIALLIPGVLFLAMAFIAARFLVARFGADPWGNQEYEPPDDGPHPLERSAIPGTSRKLGLVPKDRSGHRAGAGADALGRGSPAAG